MSLLWGSLPVYFSCLFFDYVLIMIGCVDIKPRLLLGDAVMWLVASPRRRGLMWCLYSAAVCRCISDVCLTMFLYDYVLIMIGCSWHQTTPPAGRCSDVIGCSWHQTTPPPGRCSDVIGCSVVLMQLSFCCWFDVWLNLVCFYMFLSSLLHRCRHIVMAATSAAQLCRQSIFVWCWHQSSRQVCVSCYYGRHVFNCFICANSDVGVGLWGGRLRRWKYCFILLKRHHLHSWRELTARVAIFPVGIKPQRQVEPWYKVVQRHV